jgi:acyl-CoA hydrolase
MTINPTMTFRKLVMPGDLNPAHRLFGGRIMFWADEAAAMYAMCQLETKQLVTLKVSDILFKEPVKEGDVLEFMANTLKVGRTSYTVNIDVRRKSIEDKTLPSPVVLSCQFTFVTVDAEGHSTPHKFASKE